jgi:hypothetical protein
MQVPETSLHPTPLLPERNIDTYWKSHCALFANQRNVKRAYRVPQNKTFTAFLPIIKCLLCGNTPGKASTYSVYSIFHKIKSASDASTPRYDSMESKNSYLRPSAFMKQFLSYGARRLIHGAFSWWINIYWKYSPLAFPMNEISTHLLRR